MTADSGQTKSTSLLISLQETDPIREPVAALLLEQVPWDAYTGRVTKGAVVSWLHSLMYGSEARDMDCGLNEDGSCTALLAAYPVDPDLVYTLDVTRGDLSDRVVSEVEFVELVNLQMETGVRLRYPAQEILSAEFIGPGYDRTGNLVLAPDLVISGTAITAAYPVYGALKVKYRMVVHSYSITVAPRSEAVENRYQSVAHAHWSGGLTWLAIEPPPGAEEFFDSSAACGFGGGGSVTYPPDPVNEVEGRRQRRVIRKDYCSQDVMSDVAYSY